MIGALQFAAKPRPIRPQIRISGRARKATQETAADENKLLAAAALELQRFIRSARTILLEQARTGFLARTLPGIFFAVPSAKIATHQERLAQILAAARIIGRLRIREEAKIAQEESVEAGGPLAFAEVFPSDVVPAEAVRYIRSLPVVTREQWEAFIQQHRRAAFTVSGIEQRQVLAGLRDLIAESLDAGLSPRQFDQRAAELLRNFERIGPRRLRTVYNTTVGNALTQGRREQLSDPEIRRVLSHWLFDAMVDFVVRPNHARLDGAIAPVEWWEGPGLVFQPLLGYNCRCVTIPITENRAKRMVDSGEGFDITAGVPAGAGPDAGWVRVTT